MLSISDHSLVYVVREISVSYKKTHTITELRNNETFSVDSFNRDLESLPWENVDNYDDPRQMWDCWKTMFLRVRYKRSPWLTANIKKLMIERDKLKLTAIRINTADDWQNYRKVKNNVNNEIKKAKTQYYQEHFRVHSGKPR